MLILSVAGQTALGQSMFERRKDQFPTEPGYLFIPLPYSLPGIGAGLGVLGYVSNVAGSHTDIYAYYIGGAAQGGGGGVSEVHLLPETLLLDVFGEQFRTAQIFQYQFRGMNTEKNDYQIVDIERYSAREGTLTLAFLERRIEFIAEAGTQTVELTAFREPDGDLVQELDDPIEIETDYYAYGFLVDISDDRWDPRRGFRAAVWSWYSPPDNDSEPDYSVQNTDVQFYLPVGKQSTWAFDLFDSRAVVRRKGETDPNVIVRDICPVPDPACEASPPAQDYVANQLAANANGTSQYLGGRERMQGYPQGRFEGAYTQYAGTEFRWNLTEEATPFDYFIWKDVRTAIQIAFIAETGTVAESEGELWDLSRSDYGVGFRFVTASGGVYRADYVTGDEGPQLTIIVSYPW